MVSLAWKPLFLLSCTSQALAAEAVDAVNHTYFRPSGSDVSGFPPPNVAQNHRGPCPALNALANHAYLPRDGKLLTPQLIRDAVINVFNLDQDLAVRLTGRLPQQLTLADLSVHGNLEHDASLSRDDSSRLHDPVYINATLVDFLSSKSENGVLTKQSLAIARREREAQSKLENPNYSLSSEMQMIAYGEATLLLVAMGNYQMETITIQAMESFLLHEKIPDDFKQSDTPITPTKVLTVSAEIQALATTSGA